VIRTLSGTEVPAREARVMGVVLGRLRVLPFPIIVVARNHITEYVTRNAKVLSISLVRWSSDLMGSVTLEPALVLELASDFVSSL